MKRPGWLYYRIYPGAGPDAIDYLIARTVPRALERCASDLWFFVRYLDTRGLHLRLRIRTGDTGRTAWVQKLVDPLLGDCVAALNQTATSGTPGKSGIDLDRYEPETENFGATGVSIAERVFHVSSEAAIQVLRDESEGKCARRLVALLLMQQVADAFVLNEPRSGFWKRYANYWLIREPSAEIDEWKRRFRAKASELVSRDNSALLPDQALSEQLRNSLASWRGTLTRAAAEYASLDEQQARRPGYLAFHFIHLMNNRLGILPLSEAWLATVLAEQFGRAT
jgi:thiopeptide-type bacteriocin biosynthesis protein